jgi:hypothetical protein
LNHAEERRGRGEKEPGRKGAEAKKEPGFADLPILFSPRLLFSSAPRRGLHPWSKVEPI